MVVWKLNTEQQVCISTDSGTNIACGGISKFVWQAVKDNHLIMQDPFGLARRIVYAFSLSWKRRRELKNAQAVRNLHHNFVI